MGIKKTGEIPARLEGVRGRFERWRRRRKVGTRIPDALWSAAVEMGGAYGVHRTAKVLHVLLSAGNPDRARVAPAWRPVGPIA